MSRINYRLWDLNRKLQFIWAILSVISTVKILLNARVFIINSAFSIEGDGHLLEATLLGNIQAFIYRI